MPHLLGGVFFFTGIDLHDPQGSILGPQERDRDHRNNVYMNPAKSSQECLKMSHRNYDLRNDVDMILVIQMYEQKKPLLERLYKFELIGGIQQFIYFMPFQLVSILRYESSKIPLGMLIEFYSS